ncbi:vWA domain-containing protein [Pleionea sediminis]|uniref:vWA domain-containing protein n=1 Tax=Pleionea sediminis TaxID=2569479 RepID=UPI00118473EC|nr:VWA domain-containing protein [Pleionea sediminis]
MFEFAWPFLLWLLPLPLLMYVLLPNAADQQSAALRTSLFSRWRRLSSQEGSASRGKLWHLLLAILIWIALIIAMARPQWIGEPIELPASGRDLMISIDISGSMEAKDLSLNGQRATRLEVVKDILSDFIKKRDGDRLGLILFGENAYLQTPLTFDLMTIRHMLMESDIGLAGASKTAIGDGIGLAVKRLKERPSENRVLILLTDGQNNAGALEPIEAAKLAKHAGIKVYTIGVGADKMIVNDLLFGQRVVNPSEELDEDTLTAIAQMTGGQYFRARDTQELKTIYAELDKLEPIEEEGEIYRPVKELYYLPLSAALIIYALAFLLNLMNQMIMVRRIS